MRGSHKCIPRPPLALVSPTGPATTPLPPPSAPSPWTYPAAPPALSPAWAPPQPPLGPHTAPRPSALVTRVDAFPQNVMRNSKHSMIAPMVHPHEEFNYPCWPGPIPVLIPKCAPHLGCPRIPVYLFPSTGLGRTGFLLVINALPSTFVRKSIQRCPSLAQPMGWGLLFCSRTIKGFTWPNR